jgi:hypothetical protein
MLLLYLKKSLAGGRWDINMEWQYDGKLYLTKETIYINWLKVKVKRELALNFYFKTLESKQCFTLPSFSV